MQAFKPTSSGGRIAEGDTAFGRYRVEWDATGKLIAQEIELRRPPEVIPPDFDPTTLKHRGCCDPPAGVE